MGISTQKFNSELKKLSRLTYDKEFHCETLSSKTVGEKLEEILGIKPNNSKDADTAIAEIKSSRWGSSTPVTLLTMTPDWFAPEFPAGMSDLVKRFHNYNPGTGRKNLYRNTRPAKKAPTKRPKFELRYEVTKSRNGNHKIALNQLMTKGDKRLIASWSLRDVLDQIESKLKRVLFVKWSSKKNPLGKGYLIRFEEAYAIELISREAIFESLNKGVMSIEIRAHLKEEGDAIWRLRDHGTAFRVNKTDMPAHFKEVGHMLLQSSDPKSSKVTRSKK